MIEIFASLVILQLGLCLGLLVMINSGISKLVKWTGVPSEDDFAEISINKGGINEAPGGPRPKSPPLGQNTTQTERSPR